MTLRRYNQNINLVFLYQSFLKKNSSEMTVCKELSLKLLRTELINLVIKQPIRKGNALYGIGIFVQFLIRKVFETSKYLYTIFMNQDNGYLKIR